MPRTELHFYEPDQPTGRRPYASFRLLEAKHGPFVTLTIGDQRGDEIVLYASEEQTLDRIHAAVHQARQALEQAQSFKPDLA